MILIFLFALTSHLSGQDLHADVESLVAQVSLDSLTRYVAELSGEIPIYIADSTLVGYQREEGRIDSVWVADTLLSLPNRVYWANDAATAYLEQKFRSFGYDSLFVDSYPTDDRYPETKNVLAYKPAAGGSGGPTWLIGAHYDSVLPAPGADDNASGTAVVLEAARVLAGTSTAASILFGLWDTEEAGLIGSDLFAERASEAGLRIDGVLNFDMVSWDGDKDRSFEVHADEPAVWIGEYLTGMVVDYGLDLSPFLAVGSYGRSDHVSFRKWGYPAILVIEELGSGFNPFYHSPDDVLENVDTGFFHEVAKLAVATLAQLSLSGTAVAVEETGPVPDRLLLEPIYPNPVREFAEIGYRVAASGPTRLVISNVLGMQIAVISDFASAEMREHIRWVVPRELSPGVHFLTLESADAQVTKAFVVTR